MERKGKGSKVYNLKVEGEGKEEGRRGEETGRGIEKGRGR